MGARGDPYYFAATRLRWPNTVTTAPANKNYQVHQVITGSPDYDIRNPRFFLPGFYTSQAPTVGAQAEIFPANPHNIEGLSIKIGGVWYVAPNGAFAIDPLTGIPGVLLDPIPVTIPASSVYPIKTAFNVTAGGEIIGGMTRQTINGEACDGAATSLAAKLTDDSAMANNGSVSNLYGPAFMIAQGKDAREVMIILGDSIGYGRNEASTAFATSRGEFGYIPRGLDDNTDSRRLAYGHFGCVGNRPTDWADPTLWAGKLAALAMCPNIPFTHILSQHGTNSVTSTATYATVFLPGMKAYYELLRARFPGKPITQVELLPFAASTDGYQTLANQTPSADNAYGGSYAASGTRWKFNEDVGGTDGLGDPNSTLRAGGWIDDSFAPWLVDSYDTGANRDKIKLDAFSTTLAADYTAFATTCSLTAAPTVGHTIVFNPAGTGQFQTTVTAVTGSGPYTVTLSGGGTAFTAGTSVVQVPHDTTGLHPGTFVHRERLPPTVINWKNANWPLYGEEIIPLPLAFEDAIWNTPGNVTSRSGDTFTTGGAGGMRLVSPLTIGTEYIVECEFTKLNATTLALYNSNSATNLIDSDTGTSGALSATFTAVHGDVYLRVSGADTVTVSSYSLREVLP